MAVRAVLDTPVVGDSSASVDPLARSFSRNSPTGAFTAIVSPHILGELDAVLALPKRRTRYGLTHDQASELHDAYGRLAKTITGTLSLPEGWRSVGSDPAVPAEDVPIVSVALEGGADYIVSGDAGLLEKTIGLHRLAQASPWLAAYHERPRQPASFSAQDYGGGLRPPESAHAEQTPGPTPPGGGPAGGAQPLPRASGASVSGDPIGT